MNHKPVSTGRVLLSPRSADPRPHHRLPSALPAPGKVPQRHRAALPSPRSVKLMLRSWMSNLGVTLALWQDGRDLSVPSTSIHREEMCHPSSMVVAGLPIPQVSVHAGPFGIAHVSLESSS